MPVQRALVERRQEDQKLIHLASGFYETVWQKGQLQGGGG